MIVYRPGRSVAGIEPGPHSPSYPDDLRPVRLAVALPGFIVLDNLTLGFRALGHLTAQMDRAIPAADVISTCPAGGQAQDYRQVNY